MWMGADPLAAARALGDAIYHVHAKDTRIDPVNAGVNGVIDTTPGSDYKARAWNYITLGYGHGEDVVARIRRRRSPRPATTACCRSSTRTRR